MTGSATIASLSVAGSTQFAGNITVARHLITAGGQPTPEAQAAAGAAANVTVNGTDSTGTITITTGGNPTAGALVEILFSKTYAAALHYYKGATSLTDFMFNALDTPAPNTTYSFDYFVAQ